MQQENGLILLPPPQLNTSTQTPSGKIKTQSISRKNFNKALFPFRPNKNFYTIVEKLTLENKPLLPSDRTFANMEVAEFKNIFNNITPDMLINFIKKLNNKTHCKTLERDLIYFFNHQPTRAQFLEIEKAIEECENRLSHKQKKKNKYKLEEVKQDPPQEIHSFEPDSLIEALKAGHFSVMHQILERNAQEEFLKVRSDTFNPDKKPGFNKTN